MTTPIGISREHILTFCLLKNDMTIPYCINNKAQKEKWDNLGLLLDESFGSFVSVDGTINQDEHINALTWKFHLGFIELFMTE